jgi:hypothetical protein
MRCMPTASAIVIATGRPSGTIDTIWLMATISTSASGSRATAEQHDEHEQHPAPPTSARPNCSRRRSSGVGGSSARSVRRGDAADLGVRAGGDHQARGAAGR